MAGFAYAYLGCTVLSSLLTLSGAYSAAREAEAGEERVVQRLLEAIVAAAMLGLFSIPIRLLLGIFPEPSTHSGVRFLRRALLGMLCAPVPALIVFVVGGREAKPEELVTIAMVYGLVVGIMDSIVRDRAARVELGAEEDS